MKITIVGAGYVGMSLALLLSEIHRVTIFDVNPERVELIKKGRSPIDDDEFKKYFLANDIKINATISKDDAYVSSDYVIIATPTDYDPETKNFDTKSVDEVIADVVSRNPQAIIIIKSTIPIGYTSKTRLKYKKDNIIFSPEFLREGTAIQDNQYPSRIIVGDRTIRGKAIADILSNIAISSNPKIILLDSDEAEAVKLFSNTFLAMRVAYFNEIDTFCAATNLNAYQVIDGISKDPRIGEHYKNPSFGYGGYCLPKDTKQLLANYGDIPNAIISAIVKSNDIRKKFIAAELSKLLIAKLASKETAVILGVYRLSMKSGSANQRSSAIKDVLKNIQKMDLKIIIYEPTLTSGEHDDFDVIEDITDFKEMSDLIIANRRHPDLEDVNHKLYTRDVFGGDV
ncbi:nucleotide sugar dehydrogenase [Betaproteobacteria bacterium LSUCC0117]|nr:nucleotide sugar dehydrogenase [Betaproteobacteria bacterium LSUCC0117]